MSDPYVFASSMQVMAVVTGDIPVVLNYIPQVPIALQ